MRFSIKPTSWKFICLKFHRTCVFFSSAFSGYINYTTKNISIFRSKTTCINRDFLQHIIWYECSWWTIKWIDCFNTVNYNYIFSCSSTSYIDSSTTFILYNTRGYCHDVCDTSNSWINYWLIFNNSTTILNINTLSFCCYWNRICWYYSSDSLFQIKINSSSRIDRYFNISLCYLVISDKRGFENIRTYFNIQNDIITVIIRNRALVCSDYFDSRSAKYGVVFRIINCTAYATCWLGE